MKTFLLCLLTVLLAISGYVHWLEWAQPPPAPRTVIFQPREIRPETDPFSRLAEMIRAAHQEPELAGAALGFCLLDPSGKVVVDENAQTAFIPASSFKTLTTATALTELGPNFRFSTHLSSAQPIQAGVLAGDLVIRGGGDPMVSLADLSTWAAELQKLGLQSIHGRIIGDGSHFAGSLYRDFWDWGDIGNGYGSAVSGLNLEHNRYTVTFRPGATLGAAAEVVSITPEVPGVKFLNEVTTAAANTGDAVMIHGGERTGTVTFRGTVPLATAQRETISVLGAVPDPELFAAFHFRKACQQAGIQVNGAASSAREISLPPLPFEFWEHQSPALLEIITSIHATSDNQETECVFRQMGLSQNKPPEEIIRQHWLARGLEFSALRMVDACGLARADHIRPLDLARLQFLASQGPNGEKYVNSLLKNGSVRWKGGAMSSIRSSTGYISTRQNQVYCFVLMVNHYTDSQAVSQLRNQIWEAVSGW